MPRGARSLATTAQTATTDEGSGKREAGSGKRRFPTAVAAQPLYTLSFLATPLRFPRPPSRFPHLENEQRISAGRRPAPRVFEGARGRRSRRDRGCVRAGERGQADSLSRLA